MIKAINIDWETDGEDITLPSEMIIPEEITEIAKEFDDGVITDYLSDETGFLVNSYDIEYC